MCDGPAGRSCPIAAAAAPVNGRPHDGGTTHAHPRGRRQPGSNPVLAAQAACPQAGVQYVARQRGDRRRLWARCSRCHRDSGFAFFPLRVGRRLNTYRLEVVPVSGGALPGRPVIELMVPPVRPPRRRGANADRVRPGTRLHHPGRRGGARFHRLSGGREPVGAGGERGGRGSARTPPRTDSLGRARLFVTWGGARQGGTLQVKVSGRQLAWVEVVVGNRCWKPRPVFLPAETIRGEVGSPLGAPLVFEARGRLVTRPRGAPSRSAR